MIKHVLLVANLLVTVVVFAQTSVEVDQWRLFFELKETVIEKNDYPAAVKLFERLESSNGLYDKRALGFGIIAYDKTNQTEKALELMQYSASIGEHSFCHKDYAEGRHYSTEIVGADQFRELCPVYDYATNFETEYQEFRDSLVKYLIIGSDLRHKQTLFIKMGYESYHPTGPLAKMGLVDRIKLSEVKIDSLINVFGYPTIEKVVDPWLEFLVGGSIVHSSTLERYQHYLHTYEDDMSAKDVAYVTDKIAVRLDVPQTYGTQLHLTDGVHTLYPIEDREGLNKRRMKMGLEPIEQYLKQFGIGK